MQKNVFWGQDSLYADVYDIGKGYVGVEADGKGFSAWLFVAPGQVEYLKDYVLQFAKNNPKKTTKILRKYTNV